MGADGWRGLLVGFVLAPAVVPVMVAVCLEPLLLWFRPHGSNAAVVAYVLGLASAIPTSAGNATKVD